MTLRSSNLLGVSGLAWLIAVSVVACNGGVSNSDDDPQDFQKLCGGEPKPAWGPSSCPPSFECVDGQWVDVAGDCPGPCPAEQPAEGSACDHPPQTCSYTVEEFGCEEEWTSTVQMMCIDGAWTTLEHKCSPPPECPGELPVAGSDCSDWYDSWRCTFSVETECGPAFASASCNTETWKWEVSVLSECGSCAAYGSQAACEGVAGCAWLEPGCGEPAVVAGCYPEAPCAADSCDDGEVCTTVWYNPCPDGTCDACGAETNVCLSVDAGG